MKTYSQVEGMLYNHFEKIRNRDKYKSSLDKTNKRIQIIEEELKNFNFTLSTDLQGIDYSKELITTSNDNSSSMERELIREETKLEQELLKEKKYRIKLKRKIRNIQKQIDDIDCILEILPINYIEFIKILYKDKLSYRAAGYVLKCDASTISRNKKLLIKDLMEIL